MSMIITSICENCEYGDIEELNKARVLVHCRARNKTYYFGQCIPCDDHKFIEINTKEKGELDNGSEQ